MEQNRTSATVMAIDDTPANLKLLDDILRARGYRVTSFARGDLALGAARRNPPDLILLDINMPGMDGFEVCAQLKADETLREIPVLFLSGRSETESKVRAFDSGAVDYITKPFQQDEVHVRVETHLKLTAQKRELQEAYSSLKKLESLRDSLVHMVVHDMRSMLMGTCGYLEMASAQDMPEQVANDLRNARASADRLVEMATSLLDISRFEDGDATIEVGPIDVNHMLTRSVNTLASLKRNRSLTLQVPPEGSLFTCDGRLIDRVVQNILFNALKFTDENSGTIHLRAELEPKRLRVSVEDNGPGVPSTARDRIFEKFAQLDSQDHTLSRSSGLGLAFCKLAVEAHGGEIGVQSVENGGSEFWFTLPAAPESDA